MEPIVGCIKAIIRPITPAGEHGHDACVPWPTGSSDLYTFTIPVNGQYVIETESFGATDTVVFVRSQCAIEGAAAALGCNDDEPGPPDSAVYLNGQTAGDEIYIFVDSAGRFSRGIYNLIIRYTGQ